MYGVIAREFIEEPEKKFGFLAYKYLMETDSDLEHTRKIIRKLPGGEMIEDEVLDKCLEMIMENDYNIDKAINVEVGGVKSIGNYIKDQIVYAYKKVRAEKKQLREKFGITEQSLYDTVSNHSGKASDEGSASYVEDFVADEKATFGDAKLTLEQTVDKLLKVNSTVCNGLVALVILRDCDEKSKSIALKVMGIDTPNRRDAMKEEVFDVIQDLVHFETLDIIKELYNQSADAAQLEQVMHLSLEY